MPSPSRCPDPGEFALCARGERSVEQIDALAAHLEGCPPCARLAESAVLGDQAVAGLLATGRLDTPWAGAEPDDPTVRGLIERLRALPPAPPDPGDEADAAARCAALVDEIRGALGPAQAGDEIGRLGPYRIVRALGAGGMGIVFQAEDTQLRRLVAVKVMRPDVARRPDARDRFLREARAAAAVKHEHVVTIHAVGEEHGLLFLAIEYLEGESLQAHLERRRAVPLADALRIARETARGLAAAHRLGLVHRDVKPANLWLEAPDGRVKILDFGLARPAEQAAAISQSGLVIGTPAFMAPEQARGEPLDGRSDLFSLGVVLYRLCTGAMPFRAPTAAGLLTALAVDRPPRPSALAAGLPAEVDRLVLDLLEKAPDRRPPSAQAAAERIAAIERRLEAGPPRRPRTSIAALLLAALAAGGAAGAYQLYVRNVPTAAGTAARPAEEADPERRAAEWVLRAGGKVYVLHDGAERECHELAELPAGPWQLQRVFLRNNPQATRANLDRLRGLPHLGHVNLGNSPVGDGDLDFLETLPALWGVGLAHTDITDEALKTVARCQGVGNLWLKDCRITDAGLAALVRMPHLASVDLFGTRVTDDGLTHLAAIKSLVSVGLSQTGVSRDGVSRLVAALPKCTVYSNFGTFGPAKE